MRRIDVHLDATLKPETYAIVDQRVKAAIPRWCLPSDCYDKQIETAVHMITLAYCQGSIDVQVHIATYTALLLFVDDFNVPKEASEQFIGRLMSGLPQLHPILDLVVDNLRGMADFFPRHAAQTISTSALHHINRTVFDTERADTDLSDDAMHYVQWTRIKDGIGIAYAFFIWDKFNLPDLRAYIQAIP